MVMLESGMICESASLWAVPNVYIKKRDGSWHFGKDYRMLNEWMSVVGKTTFTTPLNMYEIERRPLSLCSAWSDFQQHMQHCLAGMVKHSLLIIYSSAFESHLQDF